MPMPTPTPIYSIIHIDNLDIFLRRGGIYAPNYEPDDGLKYHCIHNADIQKLRHDRPVICGPCGTIHNYIPFYFGYLSPMLLQLKTGQVSGYNEGQEPIIYLVSNVEDVVANNFPFVFTDGHGIAFETNWFDDLKNLNQVDWDMVNERYWVADYDRDMDRQRRKQAEFLVYKFMPWKLINEIVVINPYIKKKVESILSHHSERLHCPVRINKEWYYY